MASLPIDQALRLGHDHHRAGRLAEAAAVYRTILARDPAHADALVSLGALTLQRGEPAEARACLEAFVNGRRRDLEGYLTAGQIFHVHGALDDAAGIYARALDRFPDSDEVCYRLGHIERARHKPDVAIAWFRRALSLRPRFPEALNNLGLTLDEVGAPAEAVRILEQAAKLDPDRPEVHYNLANALTHVGRLEDGIADYRRAIALNPAFTEAHNNLGSAAKSLGKLDDAVAAFQAAARLQPTWSPTYSNLAGVYELQARHDDALATHRRAIALAPTSPVAHGNLLFTMLFHPGSDAAALLREHTDWNRRLGDLGQVQAGPYANDRSTQRRLRVGYVCGLFRDHVLGRYLMPLLREHDRAAIDVICYSNNRSNDAMTDRFRQVAGAWREISILSDDAMAALIRRDAVDILVDTTLHMEGNRLLVFARRPAPVQVTFAGYPGSTGLEAMDYRFTDIHLDPPGMHDASYIEKSWRLPDTFWCYDPLGVDVETGPLPADAAGYVTFGCMNNFSKTNERVLRLWARVLGALPASRLLVLAHEGGHRQRALDLLRALGIESNRVEFVGYRSREDYLALFQRVDISLDTLPYNGHTTSLDSLWMGVPVVTLAGQTVVGRAGVSQLNNLHLRTLIARTPDEYVAIASTLAADLPALRALRLALRQRMQRSPLMDSPRFARNIESAYREMWRRWCRGLAPAAGP
jgi:protein O-GlcNAc transferase